MKTSERGLAEIASHEGIVMSKYKDSVGVWTIGIGHTKNAGAPDPEKLKAALSLDKIMQIFSSDIKKFETRVLSAFNRTLTQAQFDAAVSFDFNTGGIHRASWVKQFNKGDDQAARHSFMKWRKPREIIPRRQAECDLFFDGRYSGNGKVNVYRATSKGRVMWSSGKQVQLPNFAFENGDVTLATSNPNIPKDNTMNYHKIAGYIAVFIALLTTAWCALRFKIKKYFQ